MDRRIVVLLVLAVLCAAPLAGVRGPVGPGLGERFGPFDASGPWTDGFDDLSRVYVPISGLVGVEVAGGEVRLQAGETEGWVASSIITCPPGNRYNLVFVEATVPGASRVELSMLNASKEASMVGFANETIPGFVKVAGTDLSVSVVDPRQYPEVRIQANLVSSGADRPTLQAWSLYFCQLDEWRDELLAFGKMSYHAGVNISDGGAEINLTKGGARPGIGDYNEYPPIFAPAIGGSDWSAAYYANTGRTGYDDAAQFNHWGLGAAVFSDLNNDGYLDMVCGNDGHGGSPIDSKIFWGTSTEERWTETGATTLNMGRNSDVDLGDVNGDGEQDIVMAVHYEEPGSCVYLNEGGGSFAFNPDWTLSGEYYTYVATGDLNADGYDDIVFSESSGGSHAIHYGAADGPDSTVDGTISASANAGKPLIADLDGDGFLDLALASLVGGKVPIYLGTAGGFDTTVDMELSFDVALSALDIGDVNGDGMMDLVCGGNGKIRVFEGGLQGWDDSRKHDIIPSGQVYMLRVIDIDLDGYDDIVAPHSNSLHIYMGGATLPTSAAITKSGWSYDQRLAVAVPNVRYTPGCFGRFVTETIVCPYGSRWDVLVVEGTTPPGTYVSCSILDTSGKPVAGYDELVGRDFDLSKVPARTIRVRVAMASESNATTPRLDLVMVNWQDEMTWREQFYGGAKVDRRLGLEVAGGTLRRVVDGVQSKELLFASERGDLGFETSGLCFLDEGGLKYSSPPLTFDTRGSSALAVADVNSDGFDDVLLATYRTDENRFAARSPLFLNSPIGWDPEPNYEFNTTGASDVLLEDLDGDGHLDVVFAQEYDGTTYRVNSTLFWGSAAGWNATPDVEFETRGASGVVAADLDGDGLKDLVFSCYKDASTTTDSMVFLQPAARGFDGSSPDRSLPTLGARAVAAADLDGDGRTDLVFANSFSGGLTQIDSYIYWGKAGGDFETTPTKLGTVGASDVLVADVNGDGHLDAVFANQVDNTRNFEVGSFVYLGAGTRTWPSTPSASLPTTGAEGVAVADLDGRGWKDLVFACGQNGTSYQVPSLVYLGTSSGYPSTPDLELPTEGATAVLVHDLVEARYGGYLSQEIRLAEPVKVGTFHTVRYTAQVGSGISARLEVLDSVTRQPLVGTDLASGEREWVIADAFEVREHPAIRFGLTVDGLDGPGALVLDGLWVNWTTRVKVPPRVLGLEAAQGEVFRLGTVGLGLNVSDEYTPLDQLVVKVQMRPNGTTPWLALTGFAPSYSGGAWRATFRPLANAPLGAYDFGVVVTDSDGDMSAFRTFPSAVVVRNNLPTPPVVRIEPANATTTSRLRVTITTASTDVESAGVSYRYQWYLDGEPQANLTTEAVDPALTSRGQNWSVEVRGFDGVEVGLPAVAWAVIVNAPPQVAIPLADPEFPEDTVEDRWLDLGLSFSDPDGDALAFALTEAPEHIQVAIDPVTGKVTLTPDANWFGQQNATFVASDGELTLSQRVTITVTPVNDAPWFTTINGGPITADPMGFEVSQGGRLVITVGADDIEGDELVFSVNTTAVAVDAATGEMTFQPGIDAIGTIRYAVTMYDVASPAVKVRLNITITVLNVNDPPGDARITNPTSGEKFKVNQTLSLIGACTDPDTVLGQVLNYTWYWNGTHLLGHGSSLTVSFDTAGNYTITLNVTDGEYFREASVTIEITPKETSLPPPPPPPPPEEEGLGAVLWIGALVALVIIGGVIFLVMSRKRAAEKEAEDEEEEKREAFKQMAAAVKETAEQMEREVAESRVEKATAAPAATAKPAAPAAPAAAKSTDYEEVQHEDIVVEGLGSPAEKRGLSVKARVTEEASTEVKALFEGAQGPIPTLPAEDTQRMRLDDLKRKYQTAISRLPYGIPSPELKDKDWTWLAGALATGESKTLIDGREVTKIEGRWYYSDVRDASSFLKEHGAKPKEEPRRVAPPKAAPSVDRETLLAKLDERLALGELSEETYERLRKKYGDED